MRRVLVRCLVAPALAAGLFVSSAWAQPSGASDEAPTEHVPVLAYALALLFTLLTLVIVCMPSRKA
jgi:hypothetical protein